MYSRIVISIVLFFFVAACNSDTDLSPSEVNQLENDGAVMPVHIHGNSESRTALIVIHGGPGESAILKREATGFYRLEENHIVVYYDQRGSGISEGNVDNASLTVEQMAIDLRAVVEFTAHVTGAESIFLASLDWGGAIAVEYLASGAVHEMLKGYVAVSPGFNGPLSMARSREELILIAEEFLNDGNAVNDAPAENILSFYESNQVINRFNYEEHYDLLETILGIVINVDHEVSGAEPPAFIQSLVDHNLKFMLDNWSTANGHFLEALSVEDKLGDIGVPVKIIWGVWDRLMPISLLEDYTGLLGDASSEELLSIFPSSANRPYLEEGDRFYATVATWMDFYD